MSTKMYDLYKYLPNDLFQLYDWLPVLRKWYFIHLAEEFKPLLEKVPKMKLVEMMHEATEQGYRGLFNIEASVVIYCDNKQVYVQFFGVPDELYANEKWMLADWHYQNQSDRPEDVSEEEWEERAELVDRLLGRDYGDRPGHAGMVFVLADKSDCMHIADRAAKK